MCIAVICENCKKEKKKRQETARNDIKYKIGQCKIKQILYSLSIKKKYRSRNGTGGGNLRKKVQYERREEKEQRECMASVLEATVSADVRFAGCRLRADFQLCSDGGADYRLQRLQDHRRTERNVYKSMGGSEIFQRIFTEYKFPELMRNTLVLSILKLIFSFPIPILFAVLLNEVRNKAAKSLSRQ